VDPNLDLPVAIVRSESGQISALDDSSCFGFLAEPSDPDYNLATLTSIILLAVALVILAKYIPGERS
jgi:hypothetical protein